MSTLFAPRPALATLPAYVAGRRAASELTAALASNENPFPPLPSVQEVVARSLTRLNRYPDTTCTALRERIAAEVGVSAAEVVAGPGSVGVLQQILTAALRPGDEVVHAWRSFEAYPIATVVAGGRPVKVPLKDDETHDLDAMAAAIGHRTRVVLLCTPNNPTGTTISAEQLAAFLDRVPPHVLVVVDEAYVEFVDPGRDPRAMDQFRARPNVCVLRTFSKAYGLAGLRVGYAIAHPDLAEATRRVGIPFAVSALAQDAAIASLDARDEIAARVARVVGERERVQAVLRGQGWRLPDSEANFVWLRMPDDEAARVVQGLLDADIFVRAYAGDGLRITIAEEALDDRLLLALSRLAAG